MAVFLRPETKGRCYIIIETNKIYNMDCLEGMKQIEDHSVDMILCDLPYGVTACKWDQIIPLDKLWAEYKRIIKDDGAIVLTAIQPFTTTLIQSNRSWFKYCWYWKKNQSTGFASCRYQPLRCIEDVVVFYKASPTYNPQGLLQLLKPEIHQKKGRRGGVYRDDSLNKPYVREYVNYPKNLLEIKCERGLHPTQKPVELFSYLIQTYTNTGELVLDNCMGSGTTAIACIQTGRQYIGFETSKEYYNVALARIKEKME